MKAIVPHEGDRVKALVVGSGIPFERLARSAGIAKTTLSAYLCGRRRSLFTQIQILKAFDRLTGWRVTMGEFWGSLTSDEVRG